MDREDIDKVMELYKAVEKVKRKRTKQAIIMGIFVWLFGYVVLLTNHSLVFAKLWVMLAIIVSAIVAAIGLMHFNKPMLRFGFISFLVAIVIFIVQFIIFK